MKNNPIKFANMKINSYLCTRKFGIALCCVIINEFDSGLACSYIG